MIDASLESINFAILGEVTREGGRTKKLQEERRFRACGSEAVAHGVGTFCGEDSNIEKDQIVIQDDYVRINI